jgi:GTP-binding protein
MIFVDEVTVDIAAGSGGRGAVAFRKEKYVPHGGPSGGDGGKGGDVILEADSNLSTLLDFQFQHKYVANRGGDGASKDMYGRDSVDLVLKAPIGTVATNVETGRVVADLTHHGQRVVIAKGGRGGKGNMHFATSTLQAPKFAENGDPGEGYRVKLELKLLADVGIIGFPNVGKSSLIAAVSAVRPKIADYPFTTLIPHLGVVKVDDDPSHTFVMADIPGLIEGANEGLGLGHQFLRHIERTRLLVHVIDVSGFSGREPIADFDAINNELAKYSERLSSLPQIVALNKLDIADREQVDAIELELRARGVESIFLISAATGEGTGPLIYRLAEILPTLKDEFSTQAIPDGVVRITPETMAAQRPGANRYAQRRFKVQKSETDDDIYEVIGQGMERMVAITPMDNEHAVRRLQRILEKAGVYEKLRAVGAKDGDTVRIGTIEFEYIDEDISDEIAEPDMVGEALE